MATSPSSLTSPANAAVVIQERIKQRRLFEAQFLFGLLDEDDISPQERQVLERELDGLLAVVHDLQLQADKYLAAGEYNLARKLHREMERIAVDAPGLEDGKRHESRDRTGVEGSAPETRPPAAEPDAAPPAQVVASTETARAEPHDGKTGHNRAGRRKRKLLVATLLLLALLGAFLLMRARHDEPPVPSVQGQRSHVSIKPLSVRRSDDAENPVEGQPGGAGPSRITIGELTVEE